MSNAEVITIMILFQLSGFRTFKHFYIYYVQKHMKREFPRTVSYNRFTELMQSNSEVIYWEEVRWKWFRRLFSGEGTKIRMFRFEDGKKVYLN